MHQQNQKFVKHLLCRLSSFVDEAIGKSSTYLDYRSPRGKSFEIEHIWANHYDRYREHFDQEKDFEQARNRLGDLILLPNGQNQSYGDLPYEEKRKHYIKENALAQTLHPAFYQNHPNFAKSPLVNDLPFQPYDTFGPDAVEERQRLYYELCKRVWRTP